MLYDILKFFLPKQTEEKFRQKFRQKFAKTDGGKNGNLLEMAAFLCSQQNDHFLREWAIISLALSVT
jgi:hypothetical protein